MPSFKAIVEGQNFLFLLDDEEPQYLDFHRTLCLEADSEEAARQAALNLIKEELRAQAMWDDARQDERQISLEHIEPIDVLDKCMGDQDFIWYFPEDALFEYELRQ